jgi:mono/diheme cytochrome c family protein
MTLLRNGASGDELLRTPIAPLLRTCLITLASAGFISAADQTPATGTPPFRQYCFQCHGKAAMAGINLEQLSSQNSFGDKFQQWEKVAAALESKHMPPKQMPQPTEAQRQQAVTWIRAKLNEFAQKHEGDPGRVTIRRLTSGEYTYSVNDLTGLDLRFDRDFASDAVGGEGFANFGDVQFVDDANLERYLEAAKRVASHAVIGSGPLDFFEHPGKSGMEMSAVQRIQAIYRANGFRAVAGEGAKPYGLDRYGKAFYVAWRFRHRQILGEPKITLAELAAREGITARFAEHISSLVSQPSPTYPISDVASRWRNLPVPNGADEKQVAAARAGAEQLQTFVVDWVRNFFAAGPMESAVGDDRVFLLNDDSLKVDTKQKMQFVYRNRNQKTAKIYLTVTSLNPNARDKPFVIWRNGATRPLTGRFGAAAANQPNPRRQQQTPQTPLETLLTPETIAKLGYGKAPDGTPIDANAFAISADTTVAIEVPLPEGAFGLQVQFETEIVKGPAGDAVLRCTMSEREEVGKGRTTPVLLGTSGTPGFLSWKKGLLEFADNLPQNSHGEPTPSDRDPIPLPFDNTYNQPERDRFHYKVKYYRTDKFLVDNVLDDATRLRLDQAWNDLRMSFDYHDGFVRFIEDKYKVDFQKRSIGQLTEAEMNALPAEPRQYVKALRAEYDADMKMQRAGREGHIEDVVKFARQAWRRPLTKAEEDGLRAFYRRSRTGSEIDHATSVRSLLARVLVAPAFLYRLEQPGKLAADRALSDWEMASRLSYFLWSSIPDEELRRAAAAKELSRPEQIQRQVKRMLADPKARRLSTEFFGQWLGFYRFDQYRGVDSTRYPEFTEAVKDGMYDEAVSFFEHIVRKDRPVREMLTADYTFLTQPLAKHYGVKKEIKSKDQPELVEAANAFHRGGMLRLGAVLTSTSAPLRTSPVKRGDWILRRVLGTPTPPPPPDAGSIPADDKLFGGLTLFERLEQHKRNPTCASCHTRIDPLGFPLERFDAVGRWRDNYSDGKPVHDTAKLADDTPVNGVDGLLSYLKSQESQVLKTFSFKLLGYALGRTVLASDQPLIEKLTKAGGDATVSQLVSEIAVSRQFRYRREREDTSPAAPPQPPQQSAKNPAVNRTEKEGGL